MKKTVCELFAGVGGFRVGLEKSSKDWKTVWANQWEPSKKEQFAFNCYKSHFEKNGGVNEYTNKDIAKVDVKNIPDHSLLVGGFPCQDYSVASTGAQGIQGKKGVLWWEIERIVKGKKAPFLLLENVDRLLKSPSNQRGRDFGIILACLNKLGYAVEWRVINAADYGFQQRRRRIFIFASHKSTNYYKSIDKNRENYLHKTGFFASKFPVDVDEHLEIKTVEIDKDIQKISDVFKFQFENSGIMKNGKITTQKLHAGSYIDVPPINLGDLLEEENIPKECFLTNDEMDKWIYMKGSKRIERTSKTGHKYIFSEGAIAFPDHLDKPARTMLTSEFSKNRSTHVVRDIKTGKLRRITPVEAERINGFPDNWTKDLTRAQRFFCMGNALVVDLIEVMGEKLIEIIDNEQ